MINIDNINNPKVSDLTLDQRQHFLDHGWVRIPKAISPEVLKSFNENVWVRLGYDKEDKSTWKRERTHMPRHREVLWKDYSPELWTAICELVGGEDRIDPTLFHKAGDGLIVNLGSEKWENVENIDPRDLDNWHVYARITLI
ncbi:hypothetical protein Clacol_008252 [Clathrus columnatus]|uniref:Uncharacterized protein n=1 Tax=Clathrus columnatus TaxID=1419009 RepID=A0AAV5AHY2_9AGAM|nr:hypothetical protein Clacol_008252 [Clathrus columnatus]